jgi:hypothetical protein
MATFDSTTAQIMQQQRRQQLAQMLFNQGLQAEPTQMAGNVAIRQSPLSGLAKGLMAYQGMQGMNQADQAITDIATKREAADTTAVNEGMALLNKGDKAGALRVFSANPRGQAYAEALMKSQLDQDAAKNKPLDLGDVSKFTPESVAKFQSSGNYADLMPYVKPETITPYQQEQLNIERARLDMERDKERTSKVPAGYRLTEQGNLEAIPGGPTDPKVVAGNEQVKAQTEKNIAYKVYETARQGLISGLEDTETGPLAGRLPAVTTAQQTAEGAVSAMAPVLKQLFRTAGEGTFTDRDQELLLRMVPTRTDTPEARANKIANIDSIVKAKLGIPDDQPMGGAGAKGAVGARPPLSSFRKQ